MLSALRLQVQKVLLDVPAKRKPALRRSDDPQALLATDLPLIASEESVEAFTARMEELGWRVWTAKGWLLLDADVPVPRLQCCDAEGELGCCLSLLRRHPGETAPKESIRAIAKAAEAGTIERLCAQLHREWAAALRVHQPLPGGLLLYLCRAAQEMKKEAET